MNGFLCMQKKHSLILAYYCESSLLVIVGRTTPNFATIINALVLLILIQCLFLFFQLHV